MTLGQELVANPDWGNGEPHHSQIDPLSNAVTRKSDVPPTAHIGGSTPPAAPFDGEDMPKPCICCGKRPKRLITNKLTGKPERDQWCSAKCKKIDMNTFYRFTNSSRPCDPDHGWF